MSLFSCLASAAWWVPIACSIPAVVKAKSDLASWVRNLSGYSIMTLYHKLVGAAGEKTSTKEYRERLHYGSTTLILWRVSALIMYALSLNRASSRKTHSLLKLLLSPLPQTGCNLLCIIKLVGERQMKKTVCMHEQALVSVRIKTVKV